MTPIAAINTTIHELLVKNLSNDVHDIYERLVLARDTLLGAERAAACIAPPKRARRAAGAAKSRKQAPRASLPKATDVDRAVLAEIAKRGAVSASTLASELAIIKPAVQRALARLKKSGAIVATGKNKGARYSAVNGHAEAAS